MKTQPKPSYSVLAAFFDTYAGLLFLGALLAIFTAIIGTPLTQPFIALTFAIVLILTTILYHWLFKNKVTFLSFGEQVVGCVVEGGKKAWHNPYSANRFFMFFAMVLGLLVIGSTWDGVVRGELLSFKSILIKLFGMFFILYPTFLMGKGKIRGAITCFILFLVLTFATFGARFFFPELSGFFGILVWVFAAIATAYLGVFFYYHKRVKVKIG